MSQSRGGPEACDAALCRLGKLTRGPRFCARRALMSEFGASDAEAKRAYPQCPNYQSPDTSGAGVPAKPRQ